MASSDLIKNAARWLVGYFSLIDVSEAWIIHRYTKKMYIDFQTAMSFYEQVNLK